MRDTFSERKLSVHDVSVHVYGDAARAEFYWDFAAKFRKDGSPLATHGRETQLYQKIQGRWRWFMFTIPECRLLESARASEGMMIAGLCPVWER
jgi:ketosteroid isomerase-like protein